MTSARIRIAALALLVPVLAACDGGGISTGVDVSGTYTLRSVNGDPLPATLFEDSEVRYEIIGGELRLQADRTYETPITFRFTDKFSGDAESDIAVETGTYRVRDGDITFTPDDPADATYVGTITGSTITYTTDGTTVTFRR